jgi:protein translocase SecG subunit
MPIIIGLLTVFLVLDCLILILLILIQLPKKEAGAGIAFGGGATDALFGAGSGNALTKITKYAAGVFLGLALFLSFLRASQAGASGRRFEEELRKRAAAGPVIAPTQAPTNMMSATSVPPVLKFVTPTNAATTSPPPANPTK